MLPVSERVAPETIKRILLEDYEPRHRHAGPAYPAIVVYGYRGNPNTGLKSRIPSIKFRGTDSQLQEELDKRNERIAKREARRPTKLDIKAHKLERTIEMIAQKRIDDLERRLRIAETIKQYGGDK